MCPPDINKFLWMVRIGGSTDTGRHIKEHDYYTPTGEFRVDREGSPVLLNCLMYKMCYYRFGQVYTEASEYTCTPLCTLVSCFTPSGQAGSYGNRGGRGSILVWMRVMVAVCDQAQLRQPSSFRDCSRACARARSGHQQG